MSPAPAGGPTSSTDPSRAPGAAVIRLPAASGPVDRPAEAAPIDPWADACVVAELLAMDPHGLGGARLRGRPGPARDAWMAHLAAALPSGAPLRRIPVHASTERLLGGLDLAATLAAGRLASRRGLLAEADGGVATLAGVERAESEMIACLTAALDDGVVRTERDGVSAVAQARFAVVACDEGDGPDETAPAALRERLAFDVDLGRAAPPRRGPFGDHAAPDDQAAATRAQTARGRLDRVRCPEPILEALCAAAAALGVASPRGARFALRAARAAAALRGAEEVATEDAALAARLTLGWRATRAPVDDPEEPGERREPPGPPQDAGDDESREGDGSETSGDDAVGEMTELLVAASRAALPPGVLAGLAPLAASGARGGGAGGAPRRAAATGRPLGARPGRPEPGARLDLVATLRAAAPWQALRRREAGGPAEAGPIVLVRREDFRLRRRERPAETLTLFVVDASGSAAAQRLAEAKGAVELMLTESYVRRERVALVSFRGRGAELALPPTRALARARRALAGLPGGGGTPLAAGLDLAGAEAAAALRRGWSPSLVLLTDGRANVGRDGEGGRDAARRDALDAARRLRAAGLAAIVIDASPRPSPDAAALADAMAARYLALPRADAVRVSRAAAAARG